MSSTVAPIASSPNATSVPMPGARGVPSRHNTPAYAASGPGNTGTTHPTTPTANNTTANP
jgi:hypothetical protein